MLVRLAAALAICLAAPQILNAQDRATSQTTFLNYNRTFQLELPEGWRQIAPNEAVQLSENPKSAPDITPTSPRLLYTVGPIDKWLAGDLNGPWLRVIERKDEWYIQDDYASTVRDNWRRQSDSTDVSHQVESVQLEKIGTQQVECIVAVRTSTPKPPRAATRSLDIHIPTANQQLILSFGCPLEQFDQWQPEFRNWLATLTLARVADAPATLADRLWTPLLVGGAVGIVLLLLYKHTRVQR
jgi:hypothetical protein